MNKLILLFGVILCIAAVNARHFGDLNDREESENEDETLRRPKEYNSQSRHRKRRWQSSYGYDYPPPSYQYPDRRDYDRNSQELQQIARLLEEIASYMRRPQLPPPPPQPIYVPYPMYLPVNIPQIPNAPCPSPTNTQNTTVGVDKRINLKDMDPNQNWGLVVSNENDYDDGSDGSRPISFEPIKPKQFMKRPTPKVDHGSVQASAQAATTQAPIFQDDAPLLSASLQVPGMCKAAILSCCGMAKNMQGQCFSNIGCSSSYTGDACSAQSIQKALESFQMAYSPVQ